MNQLPTEVLGLILGWDVTMSRIDKNSLLPLRLVCKGFDNALRPYLLKTIKFEYGCFQRNSKMDVGCLEEVGGLCEAIFVDMMVIRDEEEIARLSEIFQGLISKVPELVATLASLRKYCMDESTFDVTDYHRVLKNALKHLPRMRRLKVNLPYQIIGSQGSPSTLLLATTLACLAKRDEDHAVLETLVIDHVSDTAVNNICNNPMDLNNAIEVLGGLKNLVLSVKRQECRSLNFNKNLWFLIRKADILESLCLIGWNVRRDSVTRRHRHRVPLNDWRMRSLPYPLDSSQNFTSLRYLELKRVDIDPHEFITLILDCANTLKELYIIEVYLKVYGASDLDNISLWIGHPNAEKPQPACWIAQSLRNMRHLKLDILRASGLGYDDFQPNQASRYPDYDLVSTKSDNKTFDQRFVEAVMQPEIAAKEQENPTPSSSEEESENVADDSTSAPEAHITEEILPTLDSPPLHVVSEPQPTKSIPPRPKPRMVDYDAEAFQRYHNTTSKYKRSIDDCFYNHNEHALRELQNLINVADRGMALISEEIERYRAVQVDENTGQLGNP
ncbi:hypothetical protein HYALB_00004391 [Hymenoscyphus albidus]|uniref:F-box domain-containing protein n=1 Tax=Hymenoscyphus albidus TaxID=595503 RepID=A0A9N9Q493_9HELO|nr:hypothetical protein HYALB_00004391 [Hymenoscyphus albidus]